MRLESIHFYPIKSCGGMQVARGRLTERGVEHDRRWMVVDSDGTFLSQRDHPRMALIRPRLTERGLEVRAPDLEPLVVPPPRDQSGGTRARLEVGIWKDSCAALDEGAAAAAWFSRFLSLDCRLVRQAPDADRPLASALDPADGHTQVSFADGFPLLLTSTGSLEDLNRRIGRAEAVPMDRFRANLVVSGAPAWAEDRWSRIRIGPSRDTGGRGRGRASGDGIRFAVVRACARCVITTTDQETGQRGKEPLATLARFRRSSRGVLFGQNLVHMDQGILEAGWTVQVLGEVEGREGALETSRR